MNNNLPATEADTAAATAVIPTYIVGIGASAGGLESLERLFEQMPCDTGMAFVVIQHLSPDFKTMMDELLARHTDMPIQLAADQTVIRPNAVYLLPPKKEMIIAEGRLLLTDKEARGELTLPIDRFFRSLAQDAGDRAIAIVLSGSGSDGSRGILDIKKAGGLVLCEGEQTAKFNGMPLSAQATGIVDQVLAPKDMPACLLAYSRRPDQPLPPLASAVPDEGIEAIFELLRNDCGIDFSYYKPTTITRRIERRLQLTHTLHLDGYLARLRQEPEELKNLYADLLIGVTRFFRDPECFLRLEQEIIPALIKRNDPEEQIRVWVAGCATGEEAYSLAILLHEQLTAIHRPVKVKIFATDVHRSSLDTAGAGIYSEEHLVAVSRERMQRYFLKKPDGYHVLPELRQMIVFAPHNVIKDAPFTRMDLISCRNMLIYLQPQAQKKVLSLFHFGLKTGAILLLGSSETPGDLADEFDKIDERCKLYRKRRDVRLSPTDLHLNTPRRTPLTAPAALHGSSDKPPLLEIYDQLLNRYMPSAFLVNEDRDLLDSFGGAERFLTFKARRPSSDLLDLLDVDLKATIAGGLRRARKERKTVRFAGISISTDNGEELFRLSIEPVINGKNGTFHFLIAFEALAKPASAKTDTQVSPVELTEIARAHVEALEEELRYTKENLQATIEELETSNEELQATNEELVASNEELQSTNEELNSVNEELFSVNSEYQNKIGELRELNEDMHHLLESTDIGTIFLDRHLRVRRFTPRVAEVFDLMPQDVGRPLNSFSHRLLNTTLYSDLKQVLRDGEPLEREVHSQQSRTYFLRLLPYHTNKRIDGAVLTLIDITTLEQTRTRLKQLSAIVENSGDAIVGLDLHGLIVTWNASAERLYGYAPSAVIGQPLATLLPPARQHEPAMFLQRIQAGEPVRRMETVRLRRDGTLLDVAVTFSPVRNSDGVLIGASSIERDIAARKSVERQLRVSEQNYQDLYNHAPDMYVSVALADYTVVECNETLLRLLGYAREDVVNLPVFGLYAPESREAAQRVFGECIEAGEVHDVELCLKRKDNSRLDVSLNISLVRAPDGTPLRCRLVWRDVTRRKQTEAQLREEIARREQYLAMLSHELRNPLNSLLNASEVLKSAAHKPEIENKARSIIERQILHMTRLLDDLLDVSRITRNKLELRRSRIDLVQTAVNAIETVRTVFAQYGIELHTDIVAGPLWLDGDPDRLQQVQVNLLNNAAKFSHPGKQVWLQVYRDGQTAVIRVRDQGIGISATDQSRIFDLFFQADTSLHRSAGGMGVGLTLVRTIVRLHDGEVTVHSDGVDQGSEFTLRLPLLANPLALSHDPDNPLSAGAVGLKVAIIEDLESNRTMLQALLELLGYTVCSAADGEAGLLLLERERPDLALIDIGLPRLNGYELVRQFRARYRDSRTRLIALTGYSQPADIQQAYEAGFDEYLIKPLNADKLTKLLNRWVPQT